MPVPIQRAHHFAEAGEFSLSGRYAGAVINYVWLDESGNPAEFIVSNAEIKGVLGATRLLLLSQFVPEFGVTACRPGEIPLPMVYARSVTIFQDMSVPCATYDSSWICVKPALASVASYYDKVTAWFFRKSLTTQSGPRRSSASHEARPFAGAVLESDISGPLRPRLAGPIQKVEG